MLVQKLSFRISKDRCKITCIHFRLRALPSEQRLPYNTNVRPILVHSRIKAIGFSVVPVLFVAFVVETPNTVDKAARD